ncbi:MAG: TIGR00730 family Rossman fold protein [Kiritimatiellae bacterium]|nr:TIGR00730 family Rossman fold protein [Kiritimatiellia bacterium]
MNACTVYCGSRVGAHPDYLDAASRLGKGLAARGLTLVYGGGNVGLMGALAEAALAAGGCVHGVMPRKLVDREVAHAGLTRLDVVETMHERKQCMIDQGDAYIALPGGIGTLEEIMEVLSWRNIGYFHKPVAFLNVRGIYDGLLEALSVLMREGFIDPEWLGAIVVEQDPDCLLDRLVSDPFPGRSENAPV